MLDLYNRIAALAAEKGLTLNALAKKGKNHTIVIL